MQLQNFTTELLYTIFQNLSFADQITCVSVCLFWRTIVAPICYQNIAFSDHNYRQITSITKKENWLLGIYVKSLSISTNCGPPTRETFSEMLSQLPFLKTVTVSGRHFCVYMLYLKGLNGKIQLEEIVNENQLNQTDYLGCAYQHRHSIKRLNIQLHETSVLDTPIAVLNNLLQYLKSFTKLRYLTITKGIISSETFNVLNLLQHCPDLTRFNYRDRISILATDEYFLLTPQRYRFLEQVTLDLYQLSLSHIKYILSYFPACLDLLSIKVFRMDSSVWSIEGENGKTALQSLWNYLCQSVKNVEVTLQDMSSTETNPYRRLVMYDNDVAYVSFLKSIQGNGKLVYHLLMTVTSSRAPHKRRVEIRRDECTMYLSYTLDKVDFFKYIEEDPYSFLSSNSKQQLKSVRIIMIGEKDDSNTSLVKIARWLFSTYTILDFVTFINKPSLIHKLVNVSFRPMKNDRNSRSFRDMINKEKTIAEPLCRGPAQLSFDNVRLSTSSLKEITDLFSNITRLEFVPCRITDTTHREVTLDFSEIKHLKLLALNLDERLHDGTNLYGFNLRLKNVCTKKTILCYAEIFDRQRFTYEQVNALIANDPKQRYLGSTKIPVITILYQEMERLSIGVDQSLSIFHIHLSPYPQNQTMNLYHQTHRS